MFAWQGHEIYFLLVILVIPGGIMSAAYGAIAHKICECIEERKKLLGSSSGQVNFDCNKKEEERSMNQGPTVRKVKHDRPVFRKR